LPVKYEKKKTGGKGEFMMSIPELIHKEGIKAVEHEKNLLNSQVKELNKKLRKANDKLDILESYHENIMNNVGTGILIFNSNLKVITSNSYLNKLLENHSSKSPLRLFRSYLKPDKPSLYDKLKEVVEKGKVLKLEKVEFNTPSGKSYKLNIKSLPIITNNIIIGGNLIIEDATEKVKLEELSVSERYVALGRMSGQVIHELKNPLDGTLRFINLAIKLSGENHKLKDYLFQSKKGIEKVVGIVSSLLNFPGVDCTPGKMISINKIIKDTVRFLEYKAASRKIKIIFKLDNQVSSIKNEDMCHVFSNIVNNSIDAMPNGGELKISSARKNDNNIIKFSDTGVGIPENIQQRIFDPFFTNKENGTGTGTGLGLAICMDIVTRCGGNISVDSKEGKGTTVIVSIPV
jgi:signal transduction histidine kinase